MYQVVKRNDKVVDFDITKITTAIKKAFNAKQKQYNDDTIDFLALRSPPTSRARSRTTR